MTAMLDIEAEPFDVFQVSMKSRCVLLRLGYIWHMFWEDMFKNTFKMVAIVAIFDIKEEQFKQF